MKRSIVVAVTGVPCERIDVIPLGPRPMPDTAEDPRRGGPAALQSDRFFLCLGTVEPRKNLETLLQAYGRLSRHEQAACPLVVAGGLGWGGDGYFERLRSAAEGLNAWYAGYAPDAACAAWLRAATALLAPSHYEGFGLPILEAMSMGTPVIRASISAFDEVAGTSEGAVAPEDVEGWTAALRRVVEDVPWRRSLSEAGRTRASQYDWCDVARSHDRSLERAARS